MTPNATHNNSGHGYIGGKPANPPKRPTTPAASANHRPRSGRLKPYGAGERPVDGAGFQRRYGVHVFRSVGAPMFSLGIHVDWHTPTLDLHVGTTIIQVGKNNWEGEGRVVFTSMPSSGHTDQCTCPQRGRTVGSASQSPETPQSGRPL